MNDHEPVPRLDLTELSRRLHAVNSELSVAILELELLLESGRIDPQVVEAVAEALNACRRAAETQREIWSMIDRSGERTPP